MKKRDDKPEEGGKTLVIGNKPVLELLEDSPSRVDFVYFKKGRHDKALDAIVDLCKKVKVPFKSLPAQSMDRMYRGNHQGVIAQAAALEYVELDRILRDAPDAPLPLIVVLDQVQDPGNVGVLARTLYALGGAGLVVGRHHGAYLGTGAVKASAGALNKMPVAKVANISRALEECVKAGYTVYGAGTGENSENAYACPLRLPAVLVLGNEEKGIRPGVAKHCDMSLAIPFARDFDSLNVAQAGAILIAQFSKGVLG
ncbi:23S rRNA (guanosine(2251)-2'-O)-methyltransferase RlmB [Salidesulfovibrio onnuriiensis]|uniref:23S rRNA (guanosine(2251)-2'-O)-methyltransferase RlmB n=1 Tax=Salidesulfovibrio onnuriiensis TaxID=2583823 RepID=UPI0011C78BD2|nr:23S rRNA (guanosine(2251)-2'-O)-methyltransferase RlmB [Salidesulfovibrio onnuriiensis]